ncbi:Tankyrase-1, partial [Araneus ventricosus]
TSIKNHCSAASVSQCLASKRDNDGLSAVVQYVTSIREEYSEIIKSDCSDRSPRGCNRVCTTESKYTGSSLGEINSNVENLFSLDISKALPLVSSTLGGREVYFIDKDIKYLPHVTLDKYNDGLRVVMVPSSFREGSLTCGDIINEGVKSSGSSKECNDGKVYRNCTKAFTSSGEPFIFANIERSNSSPILYLSGPRQLIAAANYPAVMHIPKGRINYKGSEYHDNTFIINYDTYGHIRGGTANNTIVMNYSPSMIFVRLDNGVIDAAGSKIELANIHNYISHSTANQNITTGCKTRYVDAGKGGGNNSIQNYDVYCQDEDYEIRKVNKKDTHLRSIKQTIFIVDKSSGSGANISSDNLKLKENLDVISVENADVAQLRINERQNDYRLDFVACDEKDEVISVKVDSFAKLVIQTKKAGITKIIKIENKSLLDIIKDMAYQKLSHAGTDIDRKIVENSKKRSKAVIIADITGSENTTAYVFAKEIAESSDNLGIIVSQIEVIKGDTILNYAVNDLNQIKLIPNNGISDEEQREYNRLLFQAVERKNLDEIRRLLVMGADVEVKGDHNLTPLSIAVRKNGGEVIDLLLDMGANINAKGAYNWTSAKWAVFDNRENLVIQLVNRGTDIGYKDNMGHTLLDTARRFGRRRIADFLREKQSEYDRDLLTAVRNRDINKVRDLLDMGANIEAQNNRGWTPLCLASQKGSLDIAKLLLDRGANIEAKGKNGWNVLHEAIYYNKPDMFKFLVERGAYINVKNGKNETPLNAARRLGRPEIESFLIAKQGEGRVRRKRRHRHGEHDRHHSSRKLLATDLSDQPEITARQDILKDSLQNDEIGYNKGGATSGASKPFSLINEGISLVKELPTNTYLAIKEVVVEGFGLVNRLVGSIYDRIPGVGEIDTVNEKTIKANEETTKYKLEFRKDIPSSTSNTPYNSADQANGNGQKQSGKHAYNYFTSKDFSGDNINYIDANLKRAYERQMPGAFKLDGKETTAETIFKMGEHYLSQVDNGTIIFLDFLIRSKGQKHISTQVKDISEQEARAYAFEITQEYKKIVEQAASKSGISMHRLNINFMEIPKEITGKIMSNKFNEISGVLKSHVEKALPGRESGDPGRLSKKNFDKFMTTFNNRINITLDESILQILHSEHNKSKVKNTEEQQRNLKDKKQPRSYLDDGSVQGLLTQAVVSK